MAENKTVSEQLIEIDAAISAILTGGQKYRIGTRELTRADLALLFQKQKELRALADTGDPELIDNTYVAVFKGR